jgi:hypothetical protein
VGADRRVSPPPRGPSRDARPHCGEHLAQRVHCARGLDHRPELDLGERGEESSTSITPKPPPPTKNSSVEKRLPYFSSHAPMPAIIIGSASGGGACRGR